MQLITGIAIIITVVGSFLILAMVFLVYKYNASKYAAAMAVQYPEEPNAPLRRVVVRRGRITSKADSRPASIRSAWQSIRNTSWLASAISENPPDTLEAQRQHIPPVPRLVLPDDVEKSQKVRTQEQALNRLSLPGGIDRSHRPPQLELPQPRANWPPRKVSPSQTGAARHTPSTLPIVSEIPLVDSTTATRKTSRKTSGKTPRPPRKSPARQSSTSPRHSKSPNEMLMLGQVRSQDIARTGGSVLALSPEIGTATLLSIARSSVAQPSVVSSPGQSSFLHSPSQESVELFFEKDGESDDQKDNKTVSRERPDNEPATEQVAAGAGEMVASPSLHAPETESHNTSRQSETHLERSKEPEEFVVSPPAQEGTAALPVSPIVSPTSPTPSIRRGATSTETYSPGGTRLVGRIPYQRIEPVSPVQRPD